MPTVRELTGTYANFMLGPRIGQDVCSTCFNFTDGYARCYACVHSESWLDILIPISYSVAHEQLHHALAGYKRLGGEAARRLGVELAAVLWRFLDEHENCVARATDTDAFELVTTVPSGERAREGRHPLRWLVGELVEPTRHRHQRLLRRSTTEVPARSFDRQKFEPLRELNGQSVLLIDDTWTTGANAQSAGAALKHAGAGRVGAVVIGRHLNRDWHENDARLRKIRSPFDWTECARCTLPDAYGRRTVSDAPSDGGARAASGPPRPGTSGCGC